MGLLGSSSKTYVSSSVISLSGDPEERPIYKNVVVSGYAAGNAGLGMAEVVQTGYLNGPGIRGRNFFRWAKTNYTSIGIPVGSLSLFTNLDLPIISALLPIEIGKTAVALEADSSVGDYIYWAEQYILENHYDLKDTAWTADVRNTDGRITIDFEDGSEEWFVPLVPVIGVPVFSSSNSWSYFDYLYVLYHYVDDTTEEISDQKILIYRRDSGNTGFDELFSDATTVGKFYPFIPIRINNEFLSETYEPEVYSDCKKAYKKATGNKFADLIEKVGSASQLDEIDHAFFVYGVSLNNADKASLKYVYRFFKETVESDNQGITISSNGTFNGQLKFDITWETVVETTGSGLVDPSKRKGDIWFINNMVEDNHITLFFQETDTFWKKLDITGLVHKNNIYNGKSISITGSQALSDLEESGFLVPLNDDIIKTMDLISSTQIMSQSAYLVLNSYKVVKKKWYQTGIFKLLVFVALIVLTIVLPPAGAAATATYAAVGTAIGLSGVLAIIAGALIVNVATMLVMQIIGKISVEIFGEKFGAIISAVVSYAVVVISGNMLAGQSLASSWGSLMSASNLIQLSYAVTGGVAQYVQASAQEMMIKTAKLNADYEAEQESIRNKWLEQFGMGHGEFDPMLLVDSTNSNFVETEAEFLSRTLLTGTDIAELSMDMVTNFTTYTLALPDKR